MVYLFNYSTTFIFVLWNLRYSLIFPILHLFQELQPPTRPDVGPKKEELVVGIPPFTNSAGEGELISNEGTLKKPKRYLTSLVHSLLFH